MAIARRNLLAALAVVAAGPVLAQSGFPGGADPDSQPPALRAAQAAGAGAESKGATAAASDPILKKPAKALFGAAKAPAPLEARAIGFYSRGCLAGARPLSIDGPAWQAMRLSRNRNWGHPELVKLVETLATDVQRKKIWPGLLVGDLAQPRGGPMLTGHASHQIGLDADIWLTPMPDRRLSDKEREDLSATSMLAADKISVDPKVWTAGHVGLIRQAATYPNVERVLVHPAIKKALCEAAAADPKSDRKWLGKVRPYWGHHYHMHIRIGCPKGSVGCQAQPPPTGDDGCGKELDDWFKALTAPPKPATAPAKPKPPLTLAQLPAECRVVLETPAPASAARGKARPNADLAQPK